MLKPLICCLYFVRCDLGDYVMWFYVVMNVGLVGAFEVSLNQISLARCWEGSKHGR